jgi:hypothetical protein
MEDSKITYDGPELFYLSINKDIETFYILEEGTQIYKLRLVSPVATEQDRNIDFSVTSNTAQKGVHYDYPSSTAVIKAGDYHTDIAIEGIYSGYADGHVDTLHIAINNEKAAAFKNNCSLILRKYCPVVLDDLYGVYLADGDRIFSGSEPYEIEVMANPNGGDTLVLRNFWRIYELGQQYPTVNAQDVKIVLDYSDPANFTAVFPTTDQNMFLYISPPFSQNIGQAFARQSGTKGTFSSCDKTITLQYDVRLEGGYYFVLDAITNMTWVRPL